MDRGIDRSAIRQLLEQLSEFGDKGKTESAANEGLYRAVKSLSHCKDSQESDSCITTHMISGRWLIMGSPDPTVRNA
jgi:hypothetical protein